jgi:hypothetical protein
MNCLKCDKELKNLMEGEPQGDASRGRTGNQPMGGSEFITYGHYGSRITDTMGNTYHIINICDDCLEAAKKSGHCKEQINLNW